MDTPSPAFYLRCVEPSFMPPMPSPKGSGPIPCLGIAHTTRECIPAYTSFPRRQWPPEDSAAAPAIPWQEAHGGPDEDYRYR
jgi:hypothetical protein